MNDLVRVESEEPEIIERFSFEDMFEQEMKRVRASLENCEWLNGHVTVSLEAEFHAFHGETGIKYNITYNPKGTYLRETVSAASIVAAINEVHRRLAFGQANHQKKLPRY